MYAQCKPVTLFFISLDNVLKFGRKWRIILIVFYFRFLTFDPAKRISAHEALAYDWFERYPPPTPPEMFPTWPAKSELGKSVMKTPITKPSSKEVCDVALEFCFAKYITDLISSLSKYSAWFTITMRFTCCYILGWSWGIRKLFQKD